MSLFVHAKRNGIWDNLLGSFVCLIIAAVLYAQPSIHGACQATRVGAQVYLMTCLWPVFVVWGLLLVSVLLPILGLVAARLVDKPSIGFLPVSLGLGLFFTVLSMSLDSRFAPFGLAAGIKCGLVFTLARDHIAALFQRTPREKTDSSG